MDALYFKAERLKSLWEEYRQTNQCTGAEYSDQSAWAREQLQPALTELDILIAKQLEWKERLAADIEDLLHEIEEKAHIFGRPVDLLIPEAAGLYFPITTSKKESLQAILDALNEEIEVTRSNLETWLAGISLYSIELNTGDVVPSKEAFDYDLCGARILPIQCLYDTLYRTVLARRNTFEDATARLHFFWKAYEYTPVDDIDKALELLFKNKPEPKDIFDNSNNDNNSNSKAEEAAGVGITGADALAGIVEDEDLGKGREYTYYSVSLPKGLSLSADVLEALGVKASIFAAEYEERRGKRDKMQKVVCELWEELSIPPDDRRVEIKKSVDEAYLEELSAEHERLRAIMREIVQRAIDKYTTQLEELWDKCLVPQNERLSFIAALHEISSTDEVYETLAAEVARLTELYTKCAKIYRLMLERRALIEKMIEFEKTASDPRRLFMNSKRLLEEEKWRKNAWPNLVKIEDKLIAACLEYEENEQKPFLHESSRYLDTLQTEISERVVNQMFFGFEQNAKEKQANKGPPGSGPPPCNRQRRESAAESTTPRSRRDSKVSIASSRSVSPVSRPLSPSSRPNASGSNRHSMYATDNGTRQVTPNADARRRSAYLEPNHVPTSARRTPSPARSVNGSTQRTASSSARRRSSSPSSSNSSSSSASSGERNGNGVTKAKDTLTPPTPAKKSLAPPGTTRRPTAGTPRPRPKSTAFADGANGPSIIPKRAAANKRMSVVVESSSRI